MRLLIAEDDTRLLKSLKHIFEANQYMVDAVSNGMDALAYAESEEYDGLIFDIMMPGMDGVEVLKRLREKGVCTPALFLTAKTAWMRARMIICRSRFPHRNCLRVSERCCEGVTTMYRIYVNLEDSF